ncbi:MAG: CRISPR-associated helicase, Cas3 family, partial [Acidobacteriota bacterium]|nr:CRISPR-associated helicase, Cas3 family [Acidobacteriota bacterium]
MINHCYSHPGKELKTHLENVREIGLQVYREKSGLNFPFPLEDLELALTHMLYYHDIGKSTVYFQEYLQCAITGKEYREKRDLKSHALISALYGAYRAYLDLTGQSREILPVIVFLSVYKHHGNFDDLRNMVVITKKDFKEVLEKQWEKLQLECIAEKFPAPFAEIHKYFEYLDVKGDLIEGRLEYYFLLNLFFSILTYADKSDAIFDREMKGEAGTAGLSLLVDNYKKEKFKNPNSSPIDGIREEIYRLCAEEIIKSFYGVQARGAGSLLRDKKEPLSIFAINVPTGSGKTLTVINTALKLLELDPTLKRIIYAFPFTSIIDQAAEIMKEIFAVNGLDHEKYLLVHHHLSEARIAVDEEIFSGDKGQFIIENWEKPFILTTFWQFFNTLISNENQMLRKFHHLADSIIVLDEIQSFPYEYWKLINRVLKEMTRVLNCRIIFLTATMPMIFSAEEGEIMDLIDRDNKTRYFQSFSRYRLSLVNDLNNITVEELFALVREEISQKADKSFLFVFNTIKSSKDFFHRVEEAFPGENLVYLSTNILPVERKQRIAMIKQDNRRKIV